MEFVDRRKRCLALATLATSAGPHSRNFLWNPATTKSFCQIVLFVWLQLQCFHCVAAGIGRLEQTAFDVVLLDLMLPDSAGLGSFLPIYAKFPEIPIVVLTGIDDDQIVADALQRGAQDYLIKRDFDREILIRSMRYAIERNRRQQAERIVLQTQLDERRRLARELHDGVIQSLSAIRLNLQVLVEKFSRSGKSQSAVAIQEIADEAYTAIHDVRLLSYDLHPSELDGKTTRQIAIELEIHTKTVDNHRHRTREKLDARSSSEMINLAKNRGLI